MNPPADPAAKVQRERDPAARFREIPSVDELLGRPRLLALAEKAGRGMVTQSARRVLAEMRDGLKTEPTESAGPMLDPAGLEERVIAGVEAMLAPSLRRVINATGVILHTNLGRAPLSAEAAAHVAQAATSYSNLEY